MTKKAVSPVIATVLLIMMVVVLAVIIFLWATSFVGEAVTKRGASAEQRCGEVSLETQYINNELQVTNKGSIPVYKLEIRAKSGGDKEIIKKDGLSIGDSNSFNIGSYDGVEIVPVILGETEKSKKAYTCKSNIFIAK